MTLVGYARVSTPRAVSRKPQYADNQVQRLTEAGVSGERIYVDDGLSGKLASRPQWDKCRDYLRGGDVLVVTKLDRLGRSLQNLVDVVNDLGGRGVEIRCLDQPIDTTTPNGKLLFHIMAAMAEWESAMARERTIEGLTAARERHGGKLPARGPSIDPGKLAVARELYDRGELPAKRIAEIVGISRASLYRTLPRGGRRTA
jgi:DNA invertase Pin-like site-specific DNA recombinase